MKPKKNLGQNFLTQDHFAHVMADAGETKDTDTIVEIGPGKGMLTRILLEKAKKVIAIEKDPELVDVLKERFKEEIKNKKLQIVEGDVREFSAKGKYKIVANIPYYITGEILRHFLEAKNKPASLTLMVQREVAERILARDQKESVLSLSIKAYGTPQIIAKVPAGNFFPKPKVDSSILHVGDISKNFFKKINEKRFFEIIRAGFAHKRKVLMRNLETLGARHETLEKIFQKENIPPLSRAEDITLARWKKIAEALDA